MTLAEAGVQADELAQAGSERELADLRTGERTPARDCLDALIADLVPAAERLGCARELQDARRLADANGAARQRAAGGPHEAARWLADVYVPGPE